MLRSSLYIPKIPWYSIWEVISSVICPWMFQVIFIHCLYKYHPPDPVVLKNFKNLDLSDVSFIILRQYVRKFMGKHILVACRDVVISKISAIRLIRVDSSKDILMFFVIFYYVVNCRNMSHSSFYSSCVFAPIDVTHISGHILYISKLINNVAHTHSQCSPLIRTHPVYSWKDIVIHLLLYRALIFNSKLQVHQY